MVHYIHANPVRAGFVEGLEHYRWSSYAAYADRKFSPPWLETKLVLSLYGGNRRRFVKEQQGFGQRNESVMKNLRHGLYMGSEDFSEECIKRAKREDHREKPQFRSLLRDKDLQSLAVKILDRLGEKDPLSVLGYRRRGFVNRDITIMVLYELGIYRNEEIGEVFGVGYTAIPAAVKRGGIYIKADPNLGKKVEAILNDN